MTLQPTNATPFEIALEHALALITEIPNPIDTLWDPWKCPAQFLPWLAWQYSVDHWRSDWPETVKRQVIASAYEVHRIKGTLPAIKAGIAGLGIEADIVRWFETEPKGAPYTMTVTAWAKPASETNIVLDAAGQQDLIEMVGATKALRTDAAIRIGSVQAGALGLAAVAAPHQTVTADTPAAMRDGAGACLGLAAGSHVAPRFRATMKAA
ncbi:MAG TPA: phage tail protein I [Azospirillum sp.]|nr:phage tail protein I [Azospirillum sp.]